MCKWDGCLKAWECLPGDRGCQLCSQPARAVDSAADSSIPASTVDMWTAHSAPQQHFENYMRLESARLLAPQMVCLLFEMIRLWLLSIRQLSIAARSWAIQQGWNESALCRSSAQTNGKYHRAWWVGDWIWHIGLESLNRHCFGFSLQLCKVSNHQKAEQQAWLLMLTSARL